MNLLHWPGQIYTDPIPIVATKMFARNNGNFSAIIKIVSKVEPILKPFGKFGPNKTTTIDGRNVKAKLIECLRKYYKILRHIIPELYYKIFAKVRFG